MAFRLEYFTLFNSFLFSPHGNARCQFIALYHMEAGLCLVKRALSSVHKETRRC
ncbi:UNVERIFIED_CONTAM: hypothetical protein FKN15_023317 [Acipenser sinensis]